MGLFTACLCKLKKENYMYNVYAVKEVTLVIKDNRFYDIDTNETYEVLKTDNNGKLNYHDEGLYFTYIRPIEEIKNRQRQR